jgi:Tfp pilus assembly protein PilF
MIASSPLLGKGTGGFEIWYPRFDRGRDREVQDKGVTQIFAHSVWLHLAAEQGVLSLCVFALLLCFVGAHAYGRLKSGGWGIYDTIAACICSIILLHGSIDIDMQMPVPKLMFWFSLGFLSRPCIREKDGWSKKAVTLKYALVIWVLAALTASHCSRIGSAYYFNNAERVSAAGNFDAAAGIISRALKWDRWNHSAWYAKGHYLHNLQQFASADSALRMSSTLKPFMPNAYVFYALNALSARDTNEALRRTDEALSWNPVNLEALQLKGNMLLGKGTLDEAETCYRAILSYDTTLTAPRFQLAIAAVRSNNVAQAKEWLNEILVIEPGRMEARQLLNEIEKIR